MIDFTKAKSDGFCWMGRKVLLTTLEWVISFLWNIFTGYNNLSHCFMPLPIKLVFHLGPGHPFLWWLFKSFCSTNFSRQAEHDREQSSSWNVLICRRKLGTVLEQSWTQHCLCFPRFSDTTCCTASRRVKKCLWRQLEQWKRLSDMAWILVFRKTNQRFRCFDNFEKTLGIFPKSFWANQL